MSLISSLTPIKETKDKLISIRNGFTYASNIAVLLVAFILIKTIEDPQLQFTLLSVIMIIVGLTINILFIIFIDEVELSYSASISYRDWAKQSDKVGSTNPVEIELINESYINPIKSDEITWRNWITQGQLYIVGISYMLSRLSNNVATSMMPFYLTSVLHIGGIRTTEEAHNKTPWQIAIIPLCLYLGSTGMSFFIQCIEKKISRKLQFLAGVVTVLIAAIPLFFIGPDDNLIIIIIIAFIYGIGFSFTLNNSMGFVSAFVGQNGKSGAFVWGFISLFDKFLSGIVLLILTSAGDLNNGTYIRFTVAGIPILTSVLGGISIFFIKNVKEYSILIKDRDNKTNIGS